MTYASNRSLSTLPSRIPLLDLRERIEALRLDVIAASEPRERLNELHPVQQAGAANLAQYLAFRQFDLRSLQTDLARLGFSSLGRAEGHVLATLNAIASMLATLDGEPLPDLPEPPVDFDGGRARLESAADRLLGPAPADREARIMVTMPSEAATDSSLVSGLLTNGMDIARINAAHDDPTVWEAMVRTIHAASAAMNRPCKIIVDLPGPKLRTGPIAPGPQVLKIKPVRDELGEVVEPGRVELTPIGIDINSAIAYLPVDGEWLAQLKLGDTVHFHDARNKKRELEIGESTEDGRIAHAYRTAYFVPGIELHRSKKDKHAATIGEFPATGERIPLAVGDTLIVTTDETPGSPKRMNDDGAIEKPARIGCTLGAALGELHTGERIWFDDGLIGGIIEQVTPAQISVRITQTPPGGAKLAAEKGINLPDSELTQPAFTPDDREILAFAVQHADLIDYSFVRRTADVTDLLNALRELGGEHLGIVLKIETRLGFEALPDLLRAAFVSDKVGVMIARGDLAVECGFARLAEVQEEILWLCEAAHVPVIWATQVLESLAKTGQPSRAEITDAAMGQRAECVMLNKGPEIVTAVHALGDILQRMETHQDKKRTLLRKLNAWD
ncbi:pyruvate kinase [soil metagenome]